jgi:hypothetical protein
MPHRQGYNIILYHPKPKLYQEHDTVIVGVYGGGEKVQLKNAMKFCTLLTVHYGQ